MTKIKFTKTYVEPLADYEIYPFLSPKVSTASSSDQDTISLTTDGGQNVYDLN
jgi:hypothetical protein